MGWLSMTNKNHPKLWELYPTVWKTESAFMSWLRGGIRRMWSKHPVRIEFMKQNRIRIPNPNKNGKTKEIWGGVCALTGELTPQTSLEVDHKKGNHSLRSIDDIQSFVESILLVTFDDLQLVSKDAHKIKSYAEKHDMTFAEAKVHKEVIELCKDKQKVVDKLSSCGVEYIPTTAKARREMLTQIMLKELENDKD